jgi:streptogramin lyase
MRAPSAFRTPFRRLALGGVLSLASGAHGLAAGLQSAPVTLDFDALGAAHALKLHVPPSASGGRLAIAISNPSVAKITPLSLVVRAGAGATFSVVPLRAGTAHVTVRGRAGKTFSAIVHVTTVTLVLHDVPGAARSLRVETYRFADGRVSGTNQNLDPASSRACAPETGGTRCVLTTGATAGAARLRVTFFAPRGARPLAIAQRIFTFTQAANAVLEISNASFVNYYPVAGTPGGSVALGPPGDSHVWFVAAAATGARIVKAAPGGTTVSFPIPKTNGAVTLARGTNSPYLWFGVYANQQPGSLLPAYVGAIGVGGATNLSTTPADGTCGVRYEPLSIAVGPNGNPWFLETLCRTIGVGTLAGGSQLNYPMPLDILGNAIYSSSPYQHQIVAGADGSLWFFVTQCGLRNYACVAELPGRGAIGQITTRGTMRFFPLPPTPGCTRGFVAVAADGNVWFAQPCPPAGAPAYVATTIGRIDPAGRVSEFFGLSSAANDIAEGPDGNVYLSTPGSIARVVTRGTRAGHIDEYLSRRGPSQLNSVGAGPDGFLYATDALGRFDRIAVPSHPDR